MIAFVLAMITLQSAAPDPTVTPAASIGDRLTGRNTVDTLAPGGSAAFDNVTVTVGCSYGTPRLGPALFSDATALARTFDTPACASATDPAAFAGTALVPFGLTNGFGTNALVSTLGPGIASEPVLRETGPALSTAQLGGSRSYVLDRLALPAEMTAPVGPVTAIHAQSPSRSLPVHRTTVRRAS